MTFDDEFNSFSNSPDGSTTTWATSYPYGGEAARTLTGNNEAEFYSDSSVGENPFSLNNGVLSIKASPAASGSNPYGLPYDSGAITTYGSFSQTYGLFEVSAKLPDEQGLWPAFWMLPASDQYTSELDVFEAIDNQPNTIYSTVHGSTNGTWGADSQAVSVPNTASGFNTYAVDWEPTTTTFYVDGQKVATEPTPASMDDPMFMILNLAVGGAGSWPGSPDGSTSFPASMQVDWVRAYATANTTSVNGSAAISSGSTGGGTTTTTPTAPSTPTTPVVSATAPVTIGSGPDSLVLDVSENAWEGDAQYTVSINGTQIGGTQTATASHDAGASQTVTVHGDWGAGIQKASIAFINDAYGGTPATDRNLYVSNVAYDGNPTTPASATLMSNGAATFTTADSDTDTSTGTVTLRLAEDAYKGNAQYAVTVDGGAPAATGTVTALNAAGQSQAVNLPGQLTAGWHDIAVSFLNDLYAGTPSTDRNLYVKSVDVNGKAAPGATAVLDSSGTSHFSIFVPS